MTDTYVAYVGSYSYEGTARGITIYDVNVENGSFSKKGEVEVNNASYLAVSNSGKYLYSIADEGIVAFKIQPDGSLKLLNTASIRGMRGCYLYLDKTDKYIFVSGYHDGKETVLSLKADGSIGGITDGVFHKSFGTVADRSFRPRINCSMLTPDQKYLCAVDLGLDQVKLYKFDSANGLIRLVDILRCELESGPRHMLFSGDGNYMYLISEIKNTISVYSYKDKGEIPAFELIQTISSAGPKCSSMTAACEIKITPDQKHLLCTNAGDNSVGIFKRDEKTGLLTQLNVLPVSGDYPKDLAIFPDGKHFAAVTHVSDRLTFFNIDYDRGLISMCSEPQPVNEPNCCIITKIPK